MKRWAFALAACLIASFASSLANAGATSQIQVSATVSPSGSLLSCDDVRRAHENSSRSCVAELAAAAQAAAAQSGSNTAPKVEVERTNRDVVVTFEY